MAESAYPKTPAPGTIECFGRVFHKNSIHAGSNLLPIDEAEAEREREMHDILVHCLRNQLGTRFESNIIGDKGIVFAPVNKLCEVMDLGFGVGEWAESLHEAVDDFNEVCEEKRELKIWGIDASRSDNPYIDGKKVIVDRSKGTFWLQLDWDLNEPMTDTSWFFVDDPDGSKWARNPMDLINIRLVSEGVREERWEPLLHECRAMLVSHGQVQIAEIAWGEIQSNSGRLYDAPGLHEWTMLFRSGMFRYKRAKPPLVHTIRKALRAAEFESVEEQCVVLDIGAWREGVDIEHAELSERLLEIMEETLKSNLAWVAQAKLQKSSADFDSIIHNAMQDLRNKDLQLFVCCHVFTGRKPMMGSIGIVSELRKNTPPPNELGSATGRLRKLPAVPRWVSDL